MGVFDLTERKALVTGGGRGLVRDGAGSGRRRGGSMIGDVLEEQGRRTAEEITASGATAGFVSLDVTNGDSWRRLLAPASLSWAGPGIAGYSATTSSVDRLTRVAAMESGKPGYGV
jgi:NAD(P)-dependent dehydrogenase (short-subunit alcohol dehydrogenase family)